jgi:toxin YoeB
LKDYNAWDDKGRQRIKDLIDSIFEDGPLKGVGRPEQLRHAWSGWNSRRIYGEHRLVYRIVGEGDAAFLQIAQCRFHYERR